MYITELVALALFLGEASFFSMKFNKLTIKQYTKRNSSGNNGSNHASGNFVKRPANGSFWDYLYEQKRRAMNGNETKVNKSHVRAVIMSYLGGTYIRF